LTVLVGNASHARLAEQVQAKQTLDQVDAVLRSLDIDKRLAFVMCEIEGMSARDAASALNVTESVVWKRVSDARKLLRQVLHQEAT
jgi:DNA-directed RNA polymerase specialized sigma24 family protein